MATTPEDDLPLGTAPQYKRMHTIIRRVCYVLLFGLVIEGALTFPLLAVWYGVPTLSPAEVCDELQKVMYSDDGRECETHDLDSPPLGGTGEAEDQVTARDEWGVQPQPQYPVVGFRELVKNKREREERAEAAEAARERDGSSSDEPGDGEPGG